MAPANGTTMVCGRQEAEVVDVVRVVKVVKVVKEQDAAETGSSRSWSPKLKGVTHPAPGVPNDASYETSHPSSQSHMRPNIAYYIRLSTGAQ
ncbi:hypothetical protein SAMD00023353_3300540 [Rosellinia necatrix]|uniref:Uncharacterized protein n=1 Tax=Rosellinia necatrix TaxID=77044 RepID=A0A1W2TK68_ROSNE|nr:hypothetical protein SAMD00023353_3300540 [Rosellinia necatrix]